MNVCAVARRDLAAVDEQAVAVLDRDDVARLGGRRVLPRDRLAVAEAPARGRALRSPGDRALRPGSGVGGHRGHYGTVALRLRSLALALLVLVATGCGLGADDRPSAAPASGVGGWEAAPAALRHLTEVAATAHRGRIWVAGGLTRDNAATDAVQVYDPATETWSEGPTLPAAVHHSALVSDGSALHLVGGFGGDAFAPVAQVWTLPDEAGPWTAGVALPQPRGAGGAAWDGGRIVYAGGVGPDGVSGAVLALTDGTWRQISRLAEPREHTAATSDGAGVVYVLGGRRGGLTGNLATADLVAGNEVRDLGELPTARGRRRRVLVAGLRGVPGRRRVTRRDEPAGRVHRRGGAAHEAARPARAAPRAGRGRRRRRGLHAARRGRAGAVRVGLGGGAPAALTAVRGRGRRHLPATCTNGGRGRGRRHMPATCTNGSRSGSNMRRVGR